MLYFHKITGFWRITGALYASAGTALSALAAHFPEDRLIAGGRTMLHSAGEVLVWHALALLIFGLTLKNPSRAVRLGVSGIQLGTVLFALGVCITAFARIHPGPIAPTGGSLLIFSWLFLAGSFFFSPETKGSFHNPGHE